MEDGTISNHAQSLPGTTINPKKETDVEKANDGASNNLVSWNGLDDPANPRNWAFRRKWTVTIVSSSFAFIASLSSSMISPALPAISKDLKVSDGTVELMFISIYVLGFAIGPLISGPLSEIYGRTVVLQVSNVVFVIFNAACGGCRTATEMIVFRFLSGLGGCASLPIGGGILSDVWSSDERGMAIGIYTLMPLLGPAIGPIAAGFIVQYSSWRWCFYSVSLCDVLVQFLSCILLLETYPRVILYRKAKRLRKETGSDDLRTEWEVLDQSLVDILRTAFKRPIILITTQPIVQCVAIYMAFLYGLMYLVLSTFARLWTGEYHEPAHIAGLNYVSARLGFLTGAQLGTRLQDRVYMALKNRVEGVGQPEFRIPLMVPSSILVPVGIFAYAWSAEKVAFWFWPNLGIYVLCASMIMCWQCMQAYVIETYTKYAASAMAAANLLRSVAGFGFPLFVSLERYGANNVS
ncbi:MAG: hypothetical protein M1820_004407 [Bogoriella megaspora]|nr:MAG: hypothetical protein M1820_004407 [Bogoriella megaspora]